MIEHTVTGQQEEVLIEEYQEGLGGQFPKTTGSGPIPPYTPLPSGALEEISHFVIGNE
ncbi:hypothetical protein RBB75_04355 [Tunturibacter empetritectus]|uniref:Uncharacterized protein n=1 Tax=Tunturiibacter empetritectus TaxID=3069691 RepID=A0AAU7ZF68_9BACT